MLARASARHMMRRAGEEISSPDDCQPSPRRGHHRAASRRARADPRHRDQRPCGCRRIGNRGESAGLREISQAPARVVLTRRRAVALGLAPRDELSGALTISVSDELPAAVIRNLADPAASLGAEPPGLGPKPLPAKGGALAAVALAKLGSLLPAALVLRIGEVKRRLCPPRGSSRDRGRRGLQARCGDRRARARRRGARPARRCGKRLPDCISAARRRPRTSRDPDRLARSGGASFGATAFRVLYRRPARQPALRLRRPAKGRDRRDRARLGVVCCSTSHRKGAASASSTNCALTACRMPASTHWMPTSSSASTPMSGCTCRRRKCCGSLVSVRSAC